MMKRLYLLLLLVAILPACTELELGSHVAKKIVFPSDAEDRVGDFKVGNPYKIKGRTYNPNEEYHYSEIGIASWYGPGFHGKLTANGEIFNQYELTAAHRTLQLPSIVRVTNLDNGRSIIVRVNDRGPFAHNRIIDLSQKAAETIGMIKKGTARVRVDVLEKESRQVARAARDGRSTRGTEMALNRGRTLDEYMPLYIAKPYSKPRISPQKLAYLQSQNINTQTDFSNMLNSQSDRRPVRKPSSSMPLIYVETSSFYTQDEAMTLKMALNHMIEPKTIYQRQNNGLQPVYSIKIGPISSQRRANDIVQTLNSRGRTSKIITVKN